MDLSAKCRHTFSTAIIACLIASIAAVCAWTLVPDGFVPERASFVLKFREESSRYRVTAVFVLPNERLVFECGGFSDQRTFRLDAPSGHATAYRANVFEWLAPGETGLHRLVLHDVSRADSMVIHAFVMVPFSALEGEYLNGYRIGKYPHIPLKQLTIYKPPRGFIEVTPENEDTLVSPHFRLGQFLSKQASGYPKYLVLRERLLLKLELILEKVNEKGYHCGTFHIMSGYRTPYYNKVIGNVKYSRHVWGGAADFFIDENPSDGMMDDLNRDGKIDYRDAGVLYDIIDEMYGRTFYVPFVGGLGRYRKSRSHGPFVHVDVRGFHARWGD